MLRNGRFQTSRIERSAKCRSDQIQVRSGGVSMIGIAAPLHRSGQLRLGAGAGRVIEHEVGFPEVAEGLGVRSV